MHPEIRYPFIVDADKNRRVIANAGMSPPLQDAERVSQLKIARKL